MTGGDFNSPVGIVLNTASTWVEWTVLSDTTNHSAPFVFRIVNAQGSDGDQRNGGFLSGQFYIDFGQSSPTPTTSSVQSTSAPSNTGKPTDNPSPVVTSQSTSSPVTTGARSTATERSPPGLSHDTTLGLGLGVGLGVPFCIAVGVALFCARKRKRPPPVTTHASAPELDYKKASPDPQELDGQHPSTMLATRYELG